MPGKQGMQRNHDKPTQPFTLSTIHACISTAAVQATVYPFAADVCMQSQLQQATARSL